MKLSDSFQKILPFGYLFLVIMGILKESIYYYQLGINILKYSTLMDILISPIADLTANPIIILILFTFIGVLYLITYILSKNHKKEWVKKMVNAKTPDKDLSEADVKRNFANMFIALTALGLLSFFLGIGIGSGKRVAENIRTEAMTYNYKMTYNTNESKDIYLIGLNSANYFYVEKGNKNVKISPVGAIKSMELTENKAFK